MTLQNMKFPEKLWSMVNECKTGSITWGIDGKSIFIDYCKFENEFLGKDSGVFKTKNVVSFIRQLNLYGFRKCSRYNDIHEFRSPYFIRGRKDLLTFLRRKPGYTLDIHRFRNEEEHDLSMTEKKENCPDASDKSPIMSPEKDEKPSRSESLPGPSRHMGLPFSNMQDLNSLSYGWWGNSSFPMNSMYSVNSLQPEKEDCSLLKVKEEKDDVIQRKEENPYWGNLDMYNNIIFVPVPAQYGYYPGFYNGNFQVPYAMRAHDDNKTGNIYDE